MSADSNTSGAFCVLFSLDIKFLNIFPPKQRVLIHTIRFLGIVATFLLPISVKNRSRSLKSIKLDDCFFSLSSCLKLNKLFSVTNPVPSASVHKHA